MAELKFEVCRGCVADEGTVMSVGDLFSQTSYTDKLTEAYIAGAKLISRSFGVKPNMAVVRLNARRWATNHKDTLNND